MTTPASHAGGGTTTNANAAKRRSADSPSPQSSALRRSSPASLHLHLDQNSNKSGGLGPHSVGGGEDRRHGLASENPGRGGTSSSSPSRHHHQHLKASAAAVGAPLSSSTSSSASPVAFLPATGGEFRPPWLPPERSEAVARLPWVQPPGSLLLYPPDPQQQQQQQHHLQQHGFALSLPPPPPRGPLFLPSLDLAARLVAGGSSSSSNGLLPPLPGLTQPLLEQLYSSSSSSNSSRTAAIPATAGSSSPLPPFYYSSASLLSKPLPSPLPSLSAQQQYLGLATGPETQKRKRPHSLVEEDAAATTDSEKEIQQSGALLSLAADGRPFKSRPSSSTSDGRPNTSPPPSVDLSGWRWRTIASSAPPLDSSGSVTAAAGASLVGVAAALPAPIMSVRPAMDTVGSSAFADASRPGHPAHFTQGSLIQLADGSLKRVEDLQTEDFLRSAAASTDVRIDHSTVVRLERPTSSSSTSSVLLTFSVGRNRVQVRVEAALEHPFYVFDRGWASCAPELTRARYQLTCRPLQVGDVCISLTHKGEAAPLTSTLSSSSVTAESSMTSTFVATAAASSSPSSPTKSLAQTGGGGGKQVAFHEVPSIYCINTDSPPNQRSSPIACSSPLPPPSSSSSLSSPIGSSWTTTKIPPSGDSDSSSAARVSAMKSGSTSKSAAVELADSRRTSKLKVENHTHKPKTTL